MSARSSWLAALVLLAPAASARAADFRLDPAQSSLTFAFTQAGARNQGRFGRFDASFSWDAAQPQAARLAVMVEIASLDTADKDRDALLRGPDLFDVARFSQARFVATSITRLDATHYRASGKLTVRDVTRDLTVPFTLTAASAAGSATHSVSSMAGQVTIKRLDYGVGQRDWKSTEWVGDDVTVSFTLRLLAQP